MASRRNISRPRSNDHGAALLIAIGVLTFLLILSVTFWQASRREMQTATNTADSIRAELLTDGAFAIAIGFLNHDLAAHPSYTSLDHAWRSYFNGAWAVGKPWLWATIDNENGIPEQVPLFNNPLINPDIETRRGIPGIPEIPTIDGLVADGFTMDRADANYFDDGIYIPRIITEPNAGVLERDVLDVDGDGDVDEFLLATNATPFAVSSDLADSLAANVLGFTLNDFVFRTFSNQGLPLSLRVTDELPDNDTLPAEQIHFWTDVDNDGDGLNDSIWIPVGSDVIFDADGIDNDLDGIIDEPGETAVFLYDGTADGLDNDRDGEVDDLDGSEHALFLTAPILDSAGVSLLDTSAFVPLAVDHALRFDLELSSLEGTPDPRIDAIDNNFDLMVNGAETFIFDNFDLSNTPDHPGLGYHQIHPKYLDPAIFRPGVIVSSSGETVSEIVGRIAILITDEASKVNINTAGGAAYRDYPAGLLLENEPLIPDGEDALTKSFSDGVGPHEYELRVVPDIGRFRARWIRQVRMGARQGIFQNGTPDTSQPPFFLDYYNTTFEADATLPGYGFVDDNANALMLALDGIDNDGNGFIDDGIIAHDYNGDGIPTISTKLEGVDEPLEYQRFRPYRNQIAENTGFDNDGDDIIDEIGELGDRFFRTHEQAKLLEAGEVVIEIEPGEFITIARGIDDDVFADLRNFITAHSQDRNDRYLHRDAQGTFTDNRLRTSTGPRLDYNVARAGEIADALALDWRYPLSQPLFVNDNPNLPDRFINNAAAIAFARGLRREDTTVATRGPLLGVTVPQFFPGTASIVMRADARLRTQQLGVSIKDFADRDFARSELTSKIDDTWWAALANPFGLDFNSLNAAQRAAQGQRISYTVAGIESIRINEIMVRPVRRFEAEAVTFAEPSDPLFALNPNRFTPTPEGDFRMRVSTTATLLGDPSLDFSNLFIRTAQEDITLEWFRDIPGATSPGLPLMGLASSYTTYQSYITLESLSDGQTFDVPDVVQFSFQATDGLPPGRYYLKLNTEFLDGGFVVPSATHESDLNFIFKISSLENDILSDIIRVGVDGFGNPGIVNIDASAWRAPAVIGSELLGGSTGTAFLQANNVYRSYIASGAPSDDFNFGAVTGFTIEVPDVAATGDWLHVAVRSTRGDGLPLVLNHFDFSQEPDHEWVEIVNIDTDTTIDVSGWELVVEGGDRLIMTIPQETFIAPGGMLLLGTNKFDEFTDIDFPDDRGPFYENGIGLARGVFFGTDFYENVTVPPTFTTRGSVFDRPQFTQDFVDRNGDGIAEGGGEFDFDDFVQSTVNPIELGNGPGGSNRFTKAWDRIVELSVPTLLPKITGSPPEIERLFADFVGRVVLSGGIFPNRPEFDGVDNDLDNHALSNDLIDNDGDGVFDDRLEGIDEGRFRRDQFDQIAWPVPGAFNSSSTDFNSFFDNILGPDTLTESPRWKEFIERRYFPGDNVIVTLYEGPAFRNRVVDRVTYNQRDVENSAIDDIIQTNDLDGDGIPDPEPLDENFTSFWPGNTMGIDFYHSLERKHPLYTGDRFGTQNRFTATDGNYDDWADSTSRWERVVNIANPLEQTGLLDRFAATAIIYDQFAHAVGGSPLRMNATQRYAEDIFLAGIVDRVRPLMFKVADARNRNIVSAGDLLTLPHISKTMGLYTIQQFLASQAPFLLDFDSPNISFGPDPAFAPDSQSRQNTSYDQAILGQNFDITDPQDFFQDLRAVIGNAAANSSLALSVGQAEVFQLAPAATFPITDWGQTISGIPEAWVPVLLHQVDGDDPSDVNDFVFDIYQHRYLMQTPSTLPLSVGTDRWPAESREAFYVSGNNQGFDPKEFHIDGNGAESLFVWDGGDGLENGEYVLYLVMGDDLRTLLRAHNTAFDSLGTGLLTDGNLISESGPADSFFGLDFVQKAIETAPEERIVDVEVFTDRNGDRRVWTDAGPPFDGLPQTGELNDGGNGAASETFGLEAGLQPGASGIIRYGVVQVENNYLAVMLRNWSDAGNVNIFSRVVLAPRDRTPGRININTVQTRRINIGDPDNPNDNDNDLNKFFNPLHGLPGILARHADNASIGPADREMVLGGTGSHVQFLARHIVQQRQRSAVETPDGRYYELTSDLLADAHALHIGSGFLQPPLVIVGDDQGSFINTNSNNRQAAFIESAFRFSRMQNLITTRSDVFEILVTVQAGYGTDTNGDGRINYRDDREFTATAEKSARTVYER